MADKHRYSGDLPDELFDDEDCVAKSISCGLTNISKMSTRLMHDENFHNRLVDEKIFKSKDHLYSYICKR